MQVRSLKPTTSAYPMSHLLVFHPSHRVQAHQRPCMQIPIPTVEMCKSQWVVVVLGLVQGVPALSGNPNHHVMSSYEPFGGV